MFHCAMKLLTTENDNYPLLNFGIIMWSYDIKKLHRAISMLDHTITTLIYYITILHSYPLWKFIMYSQYCITIVYDKVTMIHFVTTMQKCDIIMLFFFCHNRIVLCNQTIYFVIKYWILILTCSMCHCSAKL